MFASTQGAGFLIVRVCAHLPFLLPYISSFLMLLPNITYPLPYLPSPLANISYIAYLPHALRDISLLQPVQCACFPSSPQLPLYARIRRGRV